MLARNANKVSCFVEKAFQKKAWLICATKGDFLLSNIQYDHQLIPSEPEVNMARKKKKIDNSSLIQKCMSETTIHGCNHVVDRELHLVERLIWFLILIVFAGFGLAIIAVILIMSVGLHHWN